jgi:Asp-tRNA(Asn)/Glu-tRNA(Gln) amidotransferase A subunit family amidase
VDEGHPGHGHQPPLIGTGTLQPHGLSAAEAARRIAARELTSEALVASCLERIAAREPEVQAWAWLDREAALAQARARDRQSPRSPLHGVPVGIKDVIDTADMPTEYNSPIYRGYRPRWDAACVALLRLAGCVILGKTVTTEFANNHPARTRNPRDPAHTPGGSSSGSAAAVADFMVPLALGTQTGGSTIRPAAYCGVVGLKPSFNTINRAGLKFVAESLDTIGVLARSPEDASLGLQVLSGRDLPDFAPHGGRSARIGLCRTPRWGEADGATQAAVEGAARLLARAGARVGEFELPEGCAQLFEDHGVIMHYEAARALAWEYHSHADEISASLRPRIEEGWRLPRDAYDAARRLARDCRRRLAEAMRDYDFLLTPSAPGEAPATLATTGSSVFNRLWTLLGVPCVTLPFGRGSRGLPLAVQLVGSFDDDTGLLGWSHWAAGILQET